MPSAATNYVQLYPNPSFGSITIHNSSLINPRVTITDLLGRRITEASFTSDWQWDRETNSNNIVAAGAYFLIVSGTTETGEPIREVQSIVLE